MSGSWIDDHLWRSVVPELPLNPDAAIYKFWRAQRNQGVYLGPPITPEIETPIGVQQLFSSGACLMWSAEHGVSFAHDE